ncbi:MAG TPA: hypothetical protein VMB75_08445 [Rhodocyclaceae bacterium]|nr:hypothetical protein [Rhodocyclaceae bacterium]
MTSKALRLAGIAILVCGLAVGAPAMAQPHGHGGHGGGHGSGWGWGLFGLGLGLALSAPYYPYYSAPYYPPAYYPPYQPPVVIQEPIYVDPSPPQYVPQAPPPPQSEPQAPAAANWWYYCPKSRGYYPYVRTCPTGWERVSPTPQ